MKQWNSIAIALLLAGCGGDSGSGSNPFPVPSTAWQFQHSQNATLTPDAAGGVMFKFPLGVDGVHYLVRNPGGPLTGAEMVLDVEVQYTGTPRFISSDPKSDACDAPAAASLYFQRLGDTGGVSTQHYRWFATERLPIAPGVGSLRVPLTPDKWGSVLGVNGSQVPNDFEAAKAQPISVGVTFGKGCYAGHGLYTLDGIAQYTVARLTY